MISFTAVLLFCFLASVVVGTRSSQSSGSGAPAARPLSGIAQIKDTHCQSFRYSGMGQMKQWNVTCPKNIGGGGGTKLQTTFGTNLYFSYSEYKSGAINVLDTMTGIVKPFVDVSTQLQGLMSECDMFSCFFFSIFT
jgi:hypothetical protein